MSNTKIQRLQAQRSKLLAQLRRMQSESVRNLLEEDELLNQLETVNAEIRATDPRPQIGQGVIVGDGVLPSDNWEWQLRD
jgi:hypothetical protein